MNWEPKITDGFQRSKRESQDLNLLKFCKKTESRNQDFYKIDLQKPFLIFFWGQIWNLRIFETRVSKNLHTMVEIEKKIKSGCPLFTFSHIMFNKIIIPS